MLLLAVEILFFPQKIEKVFAEENPEELIGEYVETMNNHNWENFANLYCVEEQQELVNFFSDSSAFIGHQVIKKNFRERNNYEKN